MFGSAVNLAKQSSVTGFLYVALSLFCAFPGMASADESDEYQKVIIDDPYIDLHTGPGRGFPIFYVAERGAEIIILKSKTSWYKVRLKNKKEGWVNKYQLRRTLTPEGKRKDIKDITEEEFYKRNWEIGMLSGDTEGYATMTLYGNYSFSDAMAVEISISQFLGDLASGYVWSVDLVSEPFTDWWISPYFAIGTGQIEITSNTTLVQAPDIKDNQAHLAAGFKMYLTERFLFRLEYRSHIVFESQPENEEIEGWRAGFAFFF